MEETSKNNETAQLGIGAVSGSRFQSAYAQYWDKVKEDYFLHVPKQEVSGAQVNFENEPEMLNNPDIVIVMDSHSHVNMGALKFQSAQLQ